MFVKKICFVSLTFNCLLICVKGTELNSDVLIRNKRQLLFPNSTLLQFNAGVGTPSLAKNINVNWAFQANFQLPWNRTQIPTDIFGANSGYHGESRKPRHSEYSNNAKLAHFYKFIEDVLNGFGYEGKPCVQQTLCLLGAEPLHPTDDEDLLHELASFVLNPTNDIQEEKIDEESYPYIEAYQRGLNSKDCTTVYNKCNYPLIDMFSQIIVLT